MCTSSPPEGHQLCPEGLATVLYQLLVLLGMGLVPMADSPGSSLLYVPFYCLCYINVADVLFGLDGRTSPQLTAAAWTYSYPFHSIWDVGVTIVAPGGCPRCLHISYFFSFLCSR
jgi:hypothetical protein